MLRGLRTAIRTLTILPVPGRGADDMAAALPWFPVAGALIGLALYGVVRLAGIAGDWPQGAALAALAGGIVLTRGFHLDGLADWADGFWGGYDRQTVLRIMKDSQVGTFGLLAVVVVLLGKWIAYARLAEAGAATWIVAACIVSRTMPVGLAVLLPYARAEGGTGAAFVRGARRRHYFWALFVAAVLLAVFCGAAGALPLFAGWLVAGALGLWFRRRIGGVTGDLLGACAELVETVTLVGAAAAVHLLPLRPAWRVVMEGLR